MSGSIAGGFSPKDPDDEDLFVFDVTAALGNDTITGTPTMLSTTGPNSSVTGAPLVMAGVVATTTAATATVPAAVLISGWVSGGTLGASYVLSVEFTTSGGRTIRRGRQVLVARC